MRPSTIVESLLWFFIAIALVFRFVLFLPGSGVLIVLSLMSIAILYMVIGIKFLVDISRTKGAGAHVLSTDSKREKSNGFDIACGIFIILFFPSAPVGILFKLQHYPGALVNLVVGLFCSILLLVLVFSQIRNTTGRLYNFYKRMRSRAIVTTILCFTLLMISSITLWKMQNRNEPALVALYDSLERHPYNEKIMAEIDNYYNKKDSVEFAKERTERR